MAWRTRSGKSGVAQSTPVAPLLLVEDSRLFTAVLSYRFERELGLTVVHCSHYDAVKEAIEAHPAGFSLAVVDLNLPGSPYGEVLDLAQHHDIPAIVFTASFDPATRMRLMRHEVMDYVMKDSALAIDNIFHAVRRAVSNADYGILVVDPDDERRERLVRQLQKRRYRVKEASNPYDALGLVDSDPDLVAIVTETALPGMTGPELTRRIRRHHTAERLRIIGIGDGDGEFTAIDFLKSGAQDCVLRPFHVEELRCRIAAQIDAMQQVQILRATAASDYLTGLFNRRYFYEEGPKLIDRCLKHKRPAAIGVLDIDHFKRLNDTYGHEIGDRVLCAVADRLLKFLEGSGHLLCRLGGEEFGVLALGLDGQGATEFFDRMRQDLGSVRIMADEEELSIAVSIGTAEISGYETFDNYINAADQFLYMAKHRGRNQVYSDYLMAEEATRGRKLASAG